MFSSCMNELAYATCETLVTKIIRKAAQFLSDYRLKFVRRFCIIIIYFIESEIGMYQDLIDSIGFLAKYDPEVSEAMAGELKRQKRNLELIASENIVSPAVMAATSS